MVEFKYPEFEMTVQLHICNNIVEKLIELKLSWDEHDKHVDGLVITDNGTVYCLIEKNAPPLVYLHEAIHCIDHLYSYVGAEHDVDNGEIYVRQVSTLQKLFLEEIKVL